MTVNHHPVARPNASYGPNGSIILHTGAGDWHFHPAFDIDGSGPLAAADVARRYLAACIQEISKAEAVQLTKEAAAS